MNNPQRRKTDELSISDDEDKTFLEKTIIECFKRPVETANKAKRDVQKLRKAGNMDGAEAMMHSRQADLLIKLEQAVPELIHKMGTAYKMDLRKAKSYVQKILDSTRELRTNQAHKDKEAVIAEAPAYYELREDLPRKDNIQPDFEAVRAAVASLPREQQLAIVAEFADQSQAPEKPDISCIPRWQKKKTDGSAIAHLKKYYCEYLISCGAPQNLFYRQDIEAHNPELLVGITTELRTTKNPRYKGKKPRDFVPTISDEVNDRAKNLGFDEQGRHVTGKAKEVHQTGGVLRSRKHRLKHAKAPTTARL